MFIYSLFLHEKEGKSAFQVRIKNFSALEIRMKFEYNFLTPI